MLRKDGVGIRRSRHSRIGRRRKRRMKMVTGKSLLAFVVFLAVAASAAVAAATPTDGGEQAFSNPNATITDRKGRILSMFQIVRFPNSQCNGGTKNGTCFTAAECSGLGGTNSGSCASGYGVCCVLTINCGATSSQNCTYFDSSTVATGACAVTICPCSTDICQLRLDFSSFVITGPVTTSASVANTLNGVAISGGTIGASLATQCLTDTFTVTNSNGQAPPVICGTNSGEHMYVDANSNCNTLSFQLGNTAVGVASTATRSWSIKVSQYSCSYSNLAPQGCTQYFFGSTTGTFQTFNYNSGNGVQLANQQQSICFRRERGSCRICYYAAIITDFSVNGVSNAAAALNTEATCCGYGAEGTKGFDCLQVPGAVKTAGNVVKSNICGRNSGLKTTSNAGASVCSITAPFMVNFRSDNYEAANAAIAEAAIVNTGFTLGYTQDSINCAVTAVG